MNDVHAAILYHFDEIAYVMVALFSSEVIIEYSIYPKKAIVEYGLVLSQTWAFKWSNPN